MIIRDLTNYLSETFSERVLFDEPMKKHTSFRTGGPAACFVTVDTEEELIGLLQKCTAFGQTYFVMGNGSNVLVGDKGYDGLIIHLGTGFDVISVDETVIRAGAGALLSRLAAEAMRCGLMGLEFASGIPGSLGGAIFMNAGAYDGEMKQVVTRVRAVDPKGEVRELTGEEMAFGYRTSLFKQKPYVASLITMELDRGDRDTIRKTMDELAARRREKQPLEYPSAGSTFKRPEGHFAGKLIQDAGLRGFSVGGAQVSEKHCGFVINKGNATSRDVVDVIESVQKRVKEQFGVALEPEVIMLGEF
ncbi:MAG: UDP-N-acetylmuramate dehydrogenase [Lachnospiraceae bacterium]|nr:UDP-N-acetylmuramate dehydrogenase [Lachnospiraceae bacterium]